MARPRWRPFRETNKEPELVSGLSSRRYFSRTSRISGGRGRTRVLFPLPRTPHLSIGQLEIVKLERQHLAGAQAVEQHQAHQGEIAEGAEAVPETGDIVGR